MIFTIVMMDKGINIMVSRNTHKKLVKIGKKGETFDELVIRILEK